jgi:hypothetical protein
LSCVQDFAEGDEDGSRRKTGFFKTFRDKLHKGIKRKTTKLDKEGTFAVKLP